MLGRVAQPVGRPLLMSQLMSSNPGRVKSKTSKFDLFSTSCPVSGKGQGLVELMSE